MTKKVQELSKEIYILLRCRGMARIDYIIENDIPLLIEVNTVPGYTPESLIPQQLEKAGIPQREFISGIIDAAIRRYNLSQATGILRNE
jgi:D-alanine-D-alanine ligase